MADDDSRMRQRVARFERAASLAGIDPAEFDVEAVISAADPAKTSAHPDECA